MPRFKEVKSVNSGALLPTFPGAILPVPGAVLAARLSVPSRCHVLHNALP
jgi:hypothetical protein